MIESPYTPDIYTGNGVTTSFAYGNKITDKSQLKVTLFTIADETEEILVVDTDYTVSGVGEDAGGNVVYNPSGVPMASTHKLIIERVTTITQSTDYEEQGAYSAEVLERSLDKVTAILQEHEEQIARSPKVTVESGDDGNDLIQEVRDAVTATAAAQAAAEAAQTAAELAETHAETAETNAETAETNAETAEVNAEAAQAAAEAALASTIVARDAALAAKTAAETAEANAETAEANAETAQAAAELARDQAVTAKNAAETAETNAETAEANAETARDAALAAQTAAEAAAAKLLGTSTSSVAIAIASKAFTTQADKFFGVGTWLLITSDANPANYMHGQVTAYSGTSLTVNVTNIGGSGTLADWTIRVSGTQGSPSAGSISAVVEDLTPELGGNLDADNKDITDVKNLTTKGAAVGTGGDGVIVLGLGTVPSTSPANAIQIYPQDVTIPAADKDTFQSSANSLYMLINASRELGQVYTPSTSYLLGGWKFELAKNNSPTGTIKARLYAVSSDLPTGAVLAESADFDVSTLTGSIAWVTFNFLTPYSVVSGTKYVVVLERVTAVVDASNYVIARGVANSSGYANGTAVYKNTSNAWVAGNEAFGATGDLSFTAVEAAVTSAEARVRDEAGNVTTFSPHNFTNIPPEVKEKNLRDSQGLAWTYYSERQGRSINVDMFRAIQILEKLSGEQLIFTSGAEIINDKKSFKEILEKESKTDGGSK